jgi:hypothetical protein
VTRPRRGGLEAVSERGPNGPERRRLGFALALVLALAACGDRPPSETVSPDQALLEAEPRPGGPFSPDAHPEVTASLEQDLAASRSPSDGGGRAWIESALVRASDGSFAPAPGNEEGAPVFTASSRGRFHLVYEAGPLGIAEHGFLFLQVPPFWSWDNPQHAWPDEPGYCLVSTDADGVEVEPFLALDQLLGIEIKGRALREGERIRIVYGAGAAGARVDRYAERGAHIWFAVDGDGDGVRRTLDDAPRVEVQAGEPSFLIATLPSTAEPGEDVRLTLALLDAVGNAGTPFQGEITLESEVGLDLPPSVSFAAFDRGRKTVVGRATREGVYRVFARAEGASAPLERESNPLVVRPGIRTVLWGDLHGHSHLSDGTGLPTDFYEYARDVSALDVAALTDHDHWGMRFLDESPDLWREIRTATTHYHEPGRFVTLLGYEWTSWLHGHRHVLYFSDPEVGPEARAADERILSSLDPRYETPEQLWNALRGKAALTFAHHSAGGPIATNWHYAPPPELEPVTEVASVHGSSEALDAPASIYNAVPGNFVRDTLDRGYRFGFIGSGDSHDGHPGLGMSGGGFGLAAIFAPELTRGAVLAALRARETYATNGPRIHLEVELAPGAEPGIRRLAWRVAALVPIERIDFVRSGMLASEPGEGRRDWHGEREVPELAPGEYLYLRVVQVDSGAAWSSPFYGEPSDVREPKAPGEPKEPKEPGEPKEPSEPSPPAGRGGGPGAR